jgi:hypothetical protein
MLDPDFKMWSHLGSIFKSRTNLESLPIEMKSILEPRIRNQAHPHLHASCYFYERALACRNEIALYNEIRKEHEAVKRKLDTLNRPDLQNENQNISKNNQTFFQPVKSGPVLSFDADKILEIVAILRGRNNCQNNCTHPAKDLLDYFMTGIVPSKPSSVTPSTENDFNVLLAINFIKRENGRAYVGPTQSTICLDNSNFPNLPYGSAVPQTPNGTLDIDANPICDLENYRQPSALFSEINFHLMQVANENANGVSFGLINMGRCASYVEKAGHMLFYFATSDEVWFVDAQSYDGEQGIDHGCITNDLTTLFSFASQKRINQDTFSDIVFYTPIEPKYNPVAEVVVKNEMRI